ncbi:MAG: hypothetical protein FWE28_10020 [Oscillospiraceae bacterium]|nr:hypothetical protein [Oscillospiraceae bacterium]
MVSFDFDRFKEKALATAGRVADKSVGIARAAGDKAKLVGRITKLKTEIAMEKDSVRKTFADIGKLYYEKYRENPDPDMAQAVAEATLSLDVIEAKKKDVDALKKELADDFGEAADDVKDKATDLKDDIDEVVEEVVEHVKGDDEN